MARSGTARSSRRGRPRLGEQPQRREAVLDAALAELGERGYEATTMLGVARRAGASKETLYSWFANKEGLVSALILRQAGRTNAAVEAALAEDRDARMMATAIATNLLELLVGTPALALNRAAMGSPELARLLLASGRHTTGPLIEQWLVKLHERGEMAIDDAADAFRLFYGLVIQDTQIRALLGERPPSRRQRQHQAAVAVERFFALTTVNYRATTVE